MSLSCQLEDRERATPLRPTGQPLNCESCERALQEGANESVQVLPPRPAHRALQEQAVTPRGHGDGRPRSAHHQARDSPLLGQASHWPASPRCVRALIPFTTSSPSDTHLLTLSQWDQGAMQEHTWFRKDTVHHRAENPIKVNLEKHVEI